MPPFCRLTRQTVDDLVPDYDLATATVRRLRVERAGTRLTAFLQLLAPRRYAVDESPPERPPPLKVALEGVTDAVFDLSDTRGAALDPGVGGIEISLGSGGRLRAAGGEYCLDDRSWHLSAAGRRPPAGALTPSPRPAPARRTADDSRPPDTWVPTPVLPPPSCTRHAGAPLGALHRPCRSCPGARPVPGFLGSG
ncbi:hypothetical protein [Streptomyces sp. NPDC005970]|uniref:hypothetical protein n=1 Tax=Streptomyces sp. NPDC005970 TaxID=3156723 RepID=UPI0033BFED4D